MQKAYKFIGATLVTEKSKVIGLSLQADVDVTL
jgi:hypothetical protein